MAISFLEGRSLGEAVVDNPDQPTAMIAVTGFFGFSFVGGSPDEAWLADAITQIRARRPLLLLDPANVALPEAERTLPRIEFLHPDPTRQPPPTPLPEGYHFRAIDADLLARCEWRDDMVMGYGSAERLLSEGFGVCLMHGDEIVCETYALFAAEGHYEIGVVTHEAYRGKGFAYATCLHLTGECARRGMDTTWSCDLDNAGSQATARKLGYTVERPYQLLYYPRQD